MIKKKFSPQFMTVGLICLLGLAMQVKGETERSFAPAEQDSKGRYINLDQESPGRIHQGDRTVFCPPRPHCL